MHWTCKWCHDVTETSFIRIANFYLFMFHETFAYKVFLNGHDFCLLLKAIAIFQQAWKTRDVFL